MDASSPQDPETQEHERRAAPARVPGNDHDLQPENVRAPLLEHAATERNLALRQIAAEYVIARGLRKESLHKRRFNLEHEDSLALARGLVGRMSTYT